MVTNLADDGRTVAINLILKYSHIVTKTSAVATLAEFELLVLVAAMRLDDAHAVSIADDIRERTGRVVRRAAVYTTLQRLEEKGLLTTELGDARPERGGKPRRVVTPTRDGVAAVRATMTAINAMTRGVRI
jgi:DNA-binding PadR family transcriptional regulator